MSEQPTVVVEKVCWQHLCPWMIIFKTLPIACNFSILSLALLGALLNPLGWMLSQSLFFNESRLEQLELEQRLSLTETATYNSSPYLAVFRDSAEAGGVEILGIKISGPRLIFNQMIRRFGSLFSESREGWVFSYFLVGNLWSLFVWSFVGLGIARIGLLRLTRNEHGSLEEALQFGMRKWSTALSALGIPMLGVILFCIPAAMFGLVMGLDLGVVIAGCLWFIVLAFALLQVLLLLGLAVGWPLMIASVATESQNAFDAMSRAYAYTFQRPLHYVFYALIAILFGGFCWMIVAIVANGVIELSYWATSWGTWIYGADRINLIQGFSKQETFEISPMLEWGSGIIGMWNAFVRTFAVAFIYGLFWCQASAIYLLLRKEVDEVEMDEIFIEESQPFYELPPLQTDEHGIPQVQPLDQVQPLETDPEEDKL